MVASHRPTSATSTAPTGRPDERLDQTSIASFGTTVFLASDLMVFAAFFAAWFLLRGNAAAWPPTDVHLETLRPALATLALVASSVTLVLGERRFHAGDLAGLRRWLGLTIALGGAFLVNQFVEYAQLPWGIDSHVYGSAYWGLTGLHTAHVTAGVILLTLVAARSTRVKHPHRLAGWLAGTSAFWHLVDAVWIAVFVTIWMVR